MLTNINKYIIFINNIKFIKIILLYILTNTNKVYIKY